MGVREGAVTIRNITQVIHISESEPGKVWLTLEDREGGEFDEAKLYEVIKKFYDDHF